jgi:phosphoribosylglycinamide formyltransferase 1
MACFTDRRQHGNLLQQDPIMPLSLAVLISGSGSNLQSIIDKVEAGVLDAQIRLVISNKDGVYGLERARRHDIPQLVIAHRDYPDRESFDRRMIEAIRDAGADTVAMAGFMRMVTPVFLNAFPGRVLNIHPALLPSFPGTHGQADANAHGVKISGCTVHFVDEHMDNGPVIIQAAVRAMAGENPQDLGERILVLEHRIYPQALQWLAQGRLSVKGRQVFVRDVGEPATLAAQPIEALVSPPLEPGF